MLKKLNDYLFRLPQSGKMQVEGLIIASEKLLPALYRDESLKQLQKPHRYRGFTGRFTACRTCMKASAYL